MERKTSNRAHPSTINCPVVKSRSGLPLRRRLEPIGFAGKYLVIIAKKGSSGTAPIAGLSKLRNLARIIHAGVGVWSKLFFDSVLRLLGLVLPGDTLSVGELASWRVGKLAS